MTVQNSDLARNAMLNSLSTLLGASMKLQIWSGTLPTDESTAIGAQVKLIEFTMAPSAAATGSKQWIPTTLTGAAIAGAPTNASFYRLVDSAGTTCHEQGTITVTGGGGDLTLDNISIANGQTVNVTSFNKTQPG